jgi:hypothetical protein
MTSPRVNLNKLYRKPEKYQAIRDIPANEPGNWLQRDVKTGQTFFRFTGNKYGESGQDDTIILSENGSTIYPFFEMPASAFKSVY